MRHFSICNFHFAIFNLQFSFRNSASCRLASRGRILILAAALAAAAAGRPVEAGVVVLSNQTSEPVAATIVEPDGRRTEYELSPKEAAALPADAALTVEFRAGGRPRRQSLRPSGIYCFREHEHGVRLEYEELPGVQVELPAASPPAERKDFYTVPVKILADDREPTVRRLWENRYRQRLARASELFERVCRVRFEVAVVGTWNSDDNAAELQDLLADFERKVEPAPARLAIGFTGRHRTVRNDRGLGGTRGPLRPHILIREWDRNLAEPDRLEMLVHELGHFLGAVHSAESQSVMRPDISDRQARARTFQIGFDARNTLAIYLVGEELRCRPLAHLCQLPADVKAVLGGVYRSMADDLPKDTSAARFKALMDQTPGLVLARPERLREVFDAARPVVQAVGASARLNREQPRLGEAADDAPPRLDGDRLSEHYVRRAAAAAGQYPGSIAPDAFLLGLGAALDDSDLLWGNPTLRPLLRQLESPAERDARLAVLGSPTMRSRRDLARHFAVSAMLTVLLGPQTAEWLGLQKEIADSHGDSGFSFADYSANLSGIAFALAVQQRKIPLERLENGFLVDDFLPDPAAMKENIPWPEFSETYGATPGKRLFAEREELRQRILAQPGYTRQDP